MMMHNDIVRISYICQYRAAAFILKCANVGRAVMNREIDVDFICRCRQKWEQDGIGQIVSNSIIQNGPLMTAMNYEAIRKLPFDFSVDTWDGNVTDQGQSLRCWAFASLNLVRQNAINKMHMQDKSFELSQNYIYFYDQLEKCNRFLNRVIELCDKPLDQMPMLGLLRNPIMDNGQWYVFADITDKYGVVPKSVMPDTQCSPDTRYVTRILSAKLRWCAWKLRSSYSQDSNKEELYTMKEDMLSGIYGILCRFLGEPPATFSYSYYDNENNYNTIKSITPQEFFKDCCGIDNNDYMMIIHHPSDDYPFMQTYVERDNPDRGHDVLLNVDMPLIKQMVISQLKGGEQVVMGCDVAKQSHKPTGYMDNNLYDYDTLFGTEIMDIPKKERIQYRVIKGTHIMAFSGVDINPNGKSDRWKVQNSYGKGMGIDGYYVMADNWFDEYVLSVVINKKYAPHAVLEAYEKQPVHMSESARY